MDKKQYRNALRSKTMIRAAFIELLTEKPLEKITVVDVVKRSELSRNTFYAHYQDVYAVLEEFQDEAFLHLRMYLEKAMEERVFDDPLSLLQDVAEYVDDNKQTFSALLRAGRPDEFITRIRDILLEFIFVNISETGITDQKGFCLFLEVLTTGFIHLFKRYLQNEIDMSSDEIVKEINRMFRAGMPIYR